MLSARTVSMGNARAALRERGHDVYETPPVAVEALLRVEPKRLGCSVADINDVLDHFAHVTISANLRTPTLGLELQRLDNLQQAFEQQAKAGDVQAAMLVTKIIERRCVMLGLSAPPRVDQHIIEHAQPPAMTSTERIRAAIDRIRGLPKPEDKQEEDEPEGKTGGEAN